jgi:hypothetical protein
MADDDDVVIDNEHTAAALAEDLRRALDELSWTAFQLMDQMREWGDYRSPQTILRGINRALEGQIKPSGELLALLRQAVRLQRRLLSIYGATVWTVLGNGSHTTQLEDFTITLAPQSKGRWRVQMLHKGGYGPDYPRWLDSLEAAKRMAFFTLDNAQNWLLEDAKKQARGMALS